jgi:tRNA pseudouridine38-40 synthase
MLSTWSLSDGEWQYHVQADAFLYRMARRLVHVQVAVAQGRLTIDQVRLALVNQTRLPAGLAPAHGLSLVNVTYKNQQ